MNKILAVTGALVGPAARDEADVPGAINDDTKGNDSYLGGFLTFGPVFPGLDSFLVSGHRWFFG